MIDPPMDHEGFQRVPPHDIQSEVCVIGAVMLRPSDCAEAMKLLGPDDFYRPAHQLLWSMLTEMVDRGEPLDLVTTKAELEHRGQLAAAGGWDYLAAIVEGVPSSANSASYAKTVCDRARLRKIISLGTALVSDAYATMAEADELASSATTALAQLLETGQAGRTQTVHEAVAEVLSRSEAVQRGDIPPGLMTGFRCLDEKIQGLQEGNMLTIAGSTGVGKTALALKMLMNMAREGVACKVFSNEMNTHEVGMRLLQMASGVCGLVVRGGRQLVADWQKTNFAAEEFASWGKAFEITDEPMTVEQMVHETQAMQGRAGRMPGVVMVDYAQIVPVSGNMTSYEKVTHAARGVKALGQKLGVVTVLLSQLNRGPDRDKREPEDYELKGSGELEQASNHLILLWDPEKGDGEPHMAPHGGKLIHARIAKGRDNAKTPWRGSGEIRLAFHGPTTDYTEIATTPETEVRR